MTRKQSLKQLLKSRGYGGAVILKTAGGDWSGSSFGPKHPINVVAPTRRAAEAGLRAALEALPVKGTKP